MQASREASALEHDRAARSFYIGSAASALKYAPLPEFADAIIALKTYDAAPTADNLRALKEIHKGLRRPEYSYTAEDEFRFALVNVIGNVLAGLHSVNLSDAVHFCEAAYLQTRAASPWKEASRNADAALRHEADYQYELWHRCFAS
jgi:hypothetical protein